MTQIQLDLTKEQDKKVAIHKIIWDFQTKKEAVANIIEQYKEWKIEDEQ